MAKLRKIVYDADGVGFTIYETLKSTKAGPTRYWLLEDYSTGKRRLLNHKTQKAARQRADAIRAAMVKGQAHRMALSNGEWQDVCLALEIVRSVPTGDSLASAVGSWAVCIGMLDGRATLLDAVKYYLTTHKGNGPPLKPTRFANAAKLYHSFKVKDGKADSHCKNILCRLGRLEKVLPPDVRLDELSAGQLEQAVLAYDLGKKTRNEYRLVLINLYKWAMKQNPPLVPVGFNPATQMDRHDVVGADIEFPRVAELRAILAGLQAKRPDLVPMTVLVCFGALRPSEAVRLEWKEIGTEHIRLPGKKSKTGHPRQIPIQKNLSTWLAQWRKSDGFVCPPTSLPHVNAAIRRASGVRLSHDGLRHGYGTHRHQIIKNIAAVAGEMGNSARICERHYVNAFCTEQEAEKWFAIMPETPTNVISLKDAPAQKAELAATSAITSP